MDREQYERNRDSLVARLREIPGELTREVEQSRSRFADPEPRLFPVYAASDADNERIGNAAAEVCTSCFGGSLIAIGGNRALVFHNVRTATGQRLVRVNYRNASSTTVVGRLMVNGLQGIGVAFPPTGKELRSVTLRLELNDANRPNALEFGAPRGAELWLESVEVLSW